MTRLGQVVFGLLVCATVGGLFVAQRLKSQTPPVRALSKQTTTLFSPNGDGTRDTARIGFRLKRESDDVTLDVIDDRDEVVRRLLDQRHARAGVAQSVLWDGRDDDGRVAADGVYRPRVKLRRQGRTIVLPVEVALDRTPPRPVVTVLGFGERSGPAVVPAGGTTPINFRFSETAVGAPHFQVYRTDLPRPRVVASFPGRAGDDTGRWEGRVSGRPAPPGTYLIVARVRDRAGNVGAVPTTVRSGAPLRGPLPGRAGVTVRSLAVQAPLEPIVAGETTRIFVDARGRSYSWSLRRLGRSRAIDAGTGREPRLRVRAPFGRSGVYVVRIAAGGDRAAVPLVVQSAQAARVLVVLPAITWQGRNPVDDDGDGVPNALDRGEPAGTARVFAGNGYPPGFLAREAPLLTFLDRAGLRYDLTTDLGLVRGTGPGVVPGRAGVILAGDAAWLPPTLEASLRGYVERGGRLASFGTGSLRRNVTLRGSRLTDPSPPGDVDAFGSRIEPVRRDPDLRLLAFPQDRLGLFKGSAGEITGFQEAEVTGDVLAGGRLVAGAGEREDRPVIVGLRIGRGFVIRTGLPEWSASLDSNRSARALTRRIWTLLSR